MNIDTIRIIQHLAWSCSSGSLQLLQSSHQELHEAHEGVKQRSVDLMTPSISSMSIGEDSSIEKSLNVNKSFIC